MSRRDAEQQSGPKGSQERHLPSASLYGRREAAGREVEGKRVEGGKEGRGVEGVLSKRLNTGSGHHRLEICGPSKGRYKVA